MPPSAAPRAPRPNVAEDAVLAHWTRALISRAQLDEPALQQLCSTTGLPRAALTNPRATMTPAVIHRTWSALTLDAPPGTGLAFADALEPATLGLLGYLVAASSTLLGALQRVVRHQARAKAPGTLVVVARRDTVGIVDVPPPGQPAWPPALAEAVVGSYLALGRKLTGTPIHALRVRLQHARPTRHGRRIERWFGCDPTYRAAVNELVLPRAALERPITTRDPLLLSYLEPIAGGERVGPDGPLPRVRAAIAGALSDGERPSLVSVARTIAVAPRTLQRRLATAGWAFSALVDDVRRGTAERLLADPSLTRGELAQLLGYRDTSALGKGLRRLGLRARDE